MKKILISLLLSGLILCVKAQIRFPQASTTQTITQNFGISSIELTYSRPGVKERKIFGDLVPYDKIWRTGANAATKIVFKDPVEIMGHKIDTGSYVIYTIPSKDKDWTFILNRGVNNSGTDGYKESEDVFRSPIKAEKLTPKMETLSMQFANVKPENCELHIMWDDVALVIPIKTSFKEKLRSQIDAAMLTDKKPYWQAAQFYFEYDSSKPKALEMINKAIEQNKKDNPFYMVHYKARIQKDMGDNAGARVSANQSLTMSKEAGNDNYIMLNEKMLKELK